MKKRYLLILVFVFLLASALFVSIAVTPSDIVVRRSDAAVVKLAAFNGTSPSRFGSAIGIDDMNRDGYQDMVVGAYYKNLSGGVYDYTGQIYVFYGSSDGLHPYTASEANVTLNGTSPGYFGVSFVIDDINNDSNKDIIVGAYGTNPNGGPRGYTGQVYIFYGSSDGLHSYTAAQANVTLNGSFYSLFGFSMAVDNFNSDGYKDIAVGAYYSNLSNTSNLYTGQVHVFYGSSDGLHSYTANQANVTLNGTSPSNFGYKVVSADFNNDTYKDLAVGARGKNLTGGALDNTGQVNIFYGGSTGLYSYTAADANVTLNGTSVSWFGGNILADDVNKDGYSDIVISASRKNLTSGVLGTTGQASVFYGSSDGLHSYTASQANITLNGTSPEWFGSPLSAADFNNDSYKDLAVGAFYSNLSGTALSGTGQVHVFYGSAGGLHSYTSAQANISLNGTNMGYSFGYAITAANINNYSYSDLVIGSIDENLTGGSVNYWGRIFVYSFNFPPTLSFVPNQSWLEDTSITINLSQYFSDVNNDNFNITYTGNSSIAVSVDEATNVVTLTPNGDWYGTEYIMFYANDTYNGLVASNNITFTVSNTADCGDATCDSSETCTSCASDCGACAAVAGGASTASFESVHAFANIAADTPMNAEFTGIAVNEIEFTAFEEVQNARISVKESSLPSALSAPLGEVNGYITIDAPKLAGKLKEAKIKFAVEKKWLDEKGFAADEIVLQRLADNAWRELTTSKLKEDASKAYYEAVTPGFSLFAITAQKAVEETVEETNEEPEEAEETVQEEKAPEAPVIIEKQSYAWIYAILIAVLIVIAAALSFARVKKRVKNHLRKRRHRIYKK